MTDTVQVNLVITRKDMEALRAKYAGARSNVEAIRMELGVTLEKKMRPDYEKMRLEYKATPRGNKQTGAKRMAVLLWWQNDIENEYGWRPAIRFLRWQANRKIDN